jgi:serine/threonine protein kinase
MSPEMILRKPHNYANDIWSFAICLLELANHHVPNKDSFIKAMFLVATEGIAVPLEKPNIWSPVFHEFISLCLRTDPSKRPSASELLEHEFIQKAASRESMESLLSQIFMKNLLEQSGI